MVKPEKVGAQIAALRKEKQWTQSELGERLHISFQAVSKWERGEALPDTSVLVALAQELGTSVDSILSGGEKAIAYKGKLAVKDMFEGLACLERVGFLLGRQNLFFRHAIDGINGKMDMDIESMLRDVYLRECLVLEAMLCNMKAGYYFDLRDVKNSFRHEKWVFLFCEYAKQYGAEQEI